MNGGIAMRKFIFTGAAFIMAAACAMPQGGMANMKKRAAAGRYGGPAPAVPQYMDEVVSVETVPAGARVQVNGFFAGYSPAKYVVRRYWRGQPGSLALDSVMVEAQAAAPGQCDQSGIFGEGSTKVPSPVRFSMTSCAAAQTKPAGKK